MDPLERKTHVPARIVPTTPQTAPEGSRPLVEGIRRCALAILARTEIDFPRAPRLPDA